ncbi:uncharacterized protein LOC125662743 [Ostrea edulis]|uniref:uncharacterized protein LOC125662743 n=1 Tax=Ostrea edulis TaxID=37623 RepID=UPI0024AFFD85|nr:uncharacterized protein LOC125662743 [Ostrea edulis]XP_056001993.1 uncharacterized protein LOC125662743 [Ostrea edulis]
MDTVGFSSQCKARQCSQCQGDTEFYCHTCKHDLCQTCREKHVTENSTQYHNTVFYLTRHCERSFTSQCKVRMCSRCQGDSEFYCNTCRQNLCLQCKEIHVVHLDSIHHEVVIYREKFKYTFKQETCVRHPSMIYEMFCRSCKLPVCLQCSDHRGHTMMDLKTAYITRRQQHRATIHKIRSEIIYNCIILKTEIETDFKKCHTDFLEIRKKMSTKSQRIKRQMNRIFKNVNTIDVYEHRLEQSASTSVELISFLKKICISKLLWIHLSSLTKEIQKENVIESLTNVQVTERGRRMVRTESLLRELSIAFPVKDVSYVAHISLVSTNRIWISDFYTKFILTDTRGTTLDRLRDTDHSIIYGFHTVSTAGELIYIDSDRNIGKLSRVQNVKSLLIKNEQPWTPHCVFCSPSTGDILIGMNKLDHSHKDAKVNRYNNKGHHVQTTEKNKTGERIYGFPIYITESRDKDLIVSDWERGVVVTDRKENHRFTYTGPPSGDQRLDPRGVCVDALSHILVCDVNTDTIQMIDKNGQFLSLFLTKQHGIYGPYGLFYDVKDHSLWVGSGYDNTVSVYRYISRGQTDR